MGEGVKLVLDNIIFFLQRSGGGSVYWSEIIKRLNEKQIEIEFSEPQGKSINLFYQKLRDQLIHPIKKEYLNPKILSFIPHRQKYSRKFIFHSSYYRISESTTAINIVTIHDFMPEMFFKGIKRFYHSYRKRKAIVKANAIICVSENTKKDLLRYYPKLTNKLITTIPLGIAEDYYPISEENRQFKFNFKGDYILFVGRRGSYKNFMFAIEVMARIDKYHFVIVGEKLSSAEQQHLSVLKGNFTIVENPNNLELNELYNGAFCLLYPSSYEGFGIPVVEAMAAGCPVVALNESSIPEISNGAALLQNQLSVTTFVDGILRLEDEVLRSDLRRRGLENAKAFNWDSSVDKLIDFYRSVNRKFGNLN